MHSNWGLTIVLYACDFTDVDAWLRFLLSMFSVFCALLVACVLSSLQMLSGRFATGKVRHRKVRHKIGRFDTALEGPPQMS